MAEITTSLEDAQKYYEKDKQRVADRDARPHVPSGFVVDSSGKLAVDDTEYAGASFQHPGYRPFPTNVQTGG